jgi:hypothetical protein
MQESLFSSTTRQRICFYDLSGGKRNRSEFSALTPRAMIMFSHKYELPVIHKPEDLDAFDVVLFSLHCFRDFYLVADLAEYKREGQEWIAGGNACATPHSVLWIMDYVYVGDCDRSFEKILRGEREMPGMISARNPDAEVEYQDEDISDEPLSTKEVLLSKGCPRRCLFCIHPWRHRYQEQDKDVVEGFIRSVPGKGVGLVSNSSSDVSYYGELSTQLQELGKTDMIVSNAVQGITEQTVSERKREMLFGIEGMSERLRTIVNKPLKRDVLREKVSMCFRHGVQVRTVYQFNLPGETMADLDELKRDVAYLRAKHKKGSWAIPFIPNQVTANTPMQWCRPHYDLEMWEALKEFRKSLFGSKNTGIAVYVPQPLGPAKWFAQVVAEWLPITPKVAAAVRSLPKRVSVAEMTAHLDENGVKLPFQYFVRDEHTEFPWSNVKMRGDDSNLHDRYKRMLDRQWRLT